MMKYTEKIEVLKKVICNSIPMDINYKPHNGEFRMELSMIRSVLIGEEELRSVTLEGVMSNGKILMEMIVHGNTWLSVSDLPMVMKMGDRTSINQIIKDSILLADTASVVLPNLLQ